jgi:outer membrane lipoprotein-sorting protein
MKSLGRMLVLVVLGTAAQAEELPAWWQAFPDMPRLESAFVQESESAVFGKLTRQGRLKLAKGGRLRVEYRKGILLVADGASLIQYDPDARTAQRTRLRTAAADTPLLYNLLNPGALAGYYEAKAGAGESLTLEPRRQDLPRVELTGRGNLLQRIQWTDGTGARQVIQLQDPRIPPAPFPASEFTFQAPPGTRWLNMR